MFLILIVVLIIASQPSIKLLCQIREKSFDACAFAAEPASHDGAPELREACLIAPACHKRRLRRPPRHPRRTPHALAPRQEEFVHVAGEIQSVIVETSDDERKIDHVWLDIRAGEHGALRISLSTLSRISRNAGLDPRVRLGVLPLIWTELPQPGVEPADVFDYAAIEAAHRIQYVTHERHALEMLLVDKARRAIFAEAWGELYARSHAGVHQIHSRRASFAVHEDVIGKDGALRLYFAPGNQCEMLLFKFAGQP